VNITGGSSSGKITSDVYTIYLKNGTYHYNVSTTLKTYMPSYSGTFKLAGGNANQSISFMEVRYTVVFQEAGLPDGTQWYINGTSNISASSTVGNITLSLTNGTYGLEASNLSSYYAFHNRYNVTVSGSNLTEKVLYHPYSHIYGMLNPQNAVIKINGREISTINGRYSVTVTNGTYSVVVSSPGYSIFYRNLTIKAGTNISLNIILNRSTGSGSSTDKYGANDSYFIGSLVAVLAIAGIASVYSRRRH
ncbi:MAG: PEGA domain-containing protein, partial [Thermoplasmataceae archaeon]